MKKYWLNNLALAVVLALVCPSLSAAAPPKAMGKWQVVAMERDGKRSEAPKEFKIFIEFAAKGKFVASMKAGERVEKEEGTYKIDGKKLTTVVRGKTESMIFKLKGKQLILTKKLKDRTESMILKKIK